MNRAMSGLVLGLCLIMSMGVGLAEEHPLLEQAREEGRAVFYANITAVEPIMAAFEDTYGVRAEYTRVSTAVYIPTVITEFQAGRLLADVLQGPLPVLEILKEQGVLGEYVSPLAELYPDWSRDPDGVIQQFGIEYVALIYNTEIVDPEDVPTRYEDLTDPKWFDRIVMPDPTSHATTISWLVGLKENVFETEDEWYAFLEGLAANRPMFVASFGPTPAPIETGEKAIGISMPKYIVTKAPAPLDWAELEDQPIMGSPRGIAIAKNAARPNAAKLFIDYWLSEPSMRMLADDVGEYVLYEGVYPPIRGMDEAWVIPIRDLSDEEIGNWAQIFAGIFR